MNEIMFNLTTIRNFTSQNTFCPTIQEVENYCFHNEVFYHSPYLKYSFLLVLGMLSFATQNFLKSDVMLEINYWTARIFIYSYLVLIWYPVLFK